MSIKGNKFGVFKGVFTPSILTILGVIMYLRLPWIVGQAGLLATLGIIFVAHIISATTGLSVSSIATDKKVETGGTYFIISRSLGLPIGGTLGIALFIGLSFSVSLYLIGFAETLLNSAGIEPTLNNIRIAGALTLLSVTILTFISTSLALKTQFIILAVMMLSLVSVFSGKHEFAPTIPLAETVTGSLPWIALFAIFFPAVTGFEAGVSMSGDLKDPKKSIPKGTIAAILIGLIVYIALALFLSFTVNRKMLMDPAVLFKISLYSPLVVAGIWGATLSSALGSILAAPRILQATAIDRIAPKIFAKGYGAGNEPRNALLLTFVIAFVGIMIGDLNVIARVVTIFFIITYGFLNLTCAIETLAGSDFRPSFRIPGWVSLIGAAACFIVMIELDLVAMIAASAILIALFLFLKRKELSLQTGDTWGGFWSSVVKHGLSKLSAKLGKDKRNWRPNIILFSGGVSARPHLVSIGQSLVGKLGIFTNFELIQGKSEKNLFINSADVITTTDSEGNNVYTRRLLCQDIYEGMDTISRVYGFTGFEPNTILMGWGKNTSEPEKFVGMVNNLENLDFNLVFLNYNAETGFGNKTNIDLWWNGTSGNLDFGITLIKFMTSDPSWRRAKIRILLINNESRIGDNLHQIIRQVLDNHRMYGSIKIINNNIEKKSTNEIIRSYSEDTDLSILDFAVSGEISPMSNYENLNQLLSQSGTSLIIRAGSTFESVGLPVNQKVQAPVDFKEPETTLSITDKLSYPDKEILASEIYRIAVDYEEIHRKYVQQPLSEMAMVFNDSLKSVTELNESVFSSLEQILKEKNNIISTKAFYKLNSNYLSQADSLITSCMNELLPLINNQINTATHLYLLESIRRLEQVPEMVIVKYNWREFKTEKNDGFFTRINKFKKRSLARLLNKQVTRKTALWKPSALFLYYKRLELNEELLQSIGIASFEYLKSIRQNLVHMHEIILNAIVLSPGQTLLKFNLDEEKTKTAILNQNVQQKIDQSINNTLLHSFNDLYLNFEKINAFLSNPDTDTNLKTYKKVFKKNHTIIADDGHAHVYLSKNLAYYLNMIHAGFILYSLKGRISTKLAKQADELDIRIADRILAPLDRVRKIAESLSNESESIQNTDLTKNLDISYVFDLQMDSQMFFRDIQNMIQELPKEVEISKAAFIREIEKGNFTDHDFDIFEFQKHAGFYIGVELISNFRVEMDKTGKKFNDVLNNIRDIVHFTVFNLENIFHTEVDNKNQENLDLRKSLVNEMLVRIEQEQTTTREIYLQAIEKMNTLLGESFELINNQLLAGSITIRNDAHRPTNKLHSTLVGTFINSWLFLRSQWVSLIYRRSEGMLLAKRLSTFEKEHKISNQSVHELLETLLPNDEVAKKIPSYYSNLFAGNSTINKELWVGMKSPIMQAGIAIKRYHKGFGGALLITGERNSGKSSLSKFIAKEYFPESQCYIIKAPFAGSVIKTELYLAIQEAMKNNLPINMLFEQLPANQVFIFNDFELWWERTPQGSLAMDEILSFIEEYSKKHLFIINCRSQAYEFLNRLYSLDKYFLAHIVCNPFDALELKEMILQRHGAGGLHFMLNGKEEKDLNAYDYAKLFNQYFNLSGGNPGYTVRAWISNIIEANSKVLYIRAPIIPNTSRLKELSNDICLLILQFVLHRRLTISKLSRVLREEEGKAGRLIGEMLRAGLVEEKFPGVYALNFHLEPFLVEELKRNNLL